MYTASNLSNPEEYKECFLTLHLFKYHDVCLLQVSYNHRMERFIYLILLLGLVGVSFGAPLARYLPEMAATAIAFWRMGGAAAVLWATAPVKPQGKLDQKHYFMIAMAGIFLALHFVAFYSAVKRVPVANATLFATLAPVFTLLYERFFQKRPLHAGALLGFWVAIGGVVLVQAGSLRFSQGETLGNLLALLSSVFMAAVLIISEQMRGHLTTILYTRWLYLFAAVTLVAISLSSGIDLSFAPKNTIWILGLIFLPTLMGHNSINYSVKYLRPTIVGSMPLGEPILATILAWLLFSEPVSVHVVLGGSVTLTGLVILTLNRE